MHTRVLLRSLVRVCRRHTLTALPSETSSFIYFYLFVSLYATPGGRNTCASAFVKFNKASAKVRDACIAFVLRGVIELSCCAVTADEHDYDHGKFYVCW